MKLEEFENLPINYVERIRELCRAAVETTLDAEDIADEFFEAGGVPSINDYWPLRTMLAKAKITLSWE